MPLVFGVVLAVGVLRCNPPEATHEVVGTRSDAIIGGQPSTTQQTVALANAQKRSTCSGSVIKCSTVLTAKHCVKPDAPTWIYVCPEPDTQAPASQSNPACWKRVASVKSHDAFDLALVYVHGTLGISPMRRPRPDYPKNHTYRGMIRGFGGNYGPGARLWIGDAGPHPDRANYRGGGTRRSAHTLVITEWSLMVKVIPDLRDPKSGLIAFGDSGGTITANGELLAVIVDFLRTPDRFALGWPDGGAWFGGGWGAVGLRIDVDPIRSWIDQYIDPPPGLGGPGSLAAACVDDDPCASCAPGAACCEVTDGDNAGTSVCTPPGASCSGGRCAGHGGACSTASDCCSEPCNAGFCGDGTCDTSACDAANWPEGMCGCIVGPWPACAVDFVACGDSGGGGSCTREGAPHCFSGGNCGCIQGANGGVQCVPCGSDGGTSDGGTSDGGPSDGGTADAGDASDDAEADDAGVSLEASVIDPELVRRER